MNNQSFPQNMGGGPQQGDMSGAPTGAPVTAFLRQGLPGSGMMGAGALNMNNNGMGNSNPMAAMMNNQSQMTGMGMPGMSGMSGMPGMNNFNLNDLKRLQQLQQQLQGGTPGNPLLTSGVSQQDPSAALLQSFLDQKIQSSRFDESLRNQLGMGGIPGVGAQGNGMLGSNLLQERLMMNQGNAGGVKGAPGDLPLPSPHSLFHRDGSRRMRGGVIEPFPEKLHRLLVEVEAAGRGDVISFVANGRAFAIHKPDKFFKEIVPLYFRQSRLSSFKRQLNLYGFELINTGPARGGYYHELFVKDRPEMCRRMRRVAVKVSPKGEGGDNADANDDTKVQPGTEGESSEPGVGGSEREETESAAA
eukprot:Nitzschia sp. Nitz4//scaffold85_size83877//54494//55573//NITZ4_005236-RA/size83877-processed-gene-0.29-mRNA-1//1//CDS//3329559158//2524//frame0